MTEALHLLMKLFQMGVIDTVVGTLRAMAAGDHDEAKREAERGAKAAAAHLAIDQMK